jgi:SM-20-related protein
VSSSSIDAVADEAAGALADAGWTVIRHFLPEDQIQTLAADARARFADGAFRQARIGRGQEARLVPGIRADLVCWLDPGQEAGAHRGYFDRIEALRLALNARLYLGLFGFEAHLAVYPPGAFYRRHVDTFAGTARRVLSTVLYLNPDWADADGGHLRLYAPAHGAEEVHDIPPTGGSLALFLSDRIEHEVLPAARERLSITGWFLRRGSE